MPNQMNSHKSLYIEDHHILLQNLTLPPLKLGCAVMFPEQEKLLQRVVAEAPPDRVLLCMRGGDSDEDSTFAATTCIPAAVVVFAAVVQERRKVVQLGYQGGRKIVEIVAT